MTSSCRSGTSSCGYFLNQNFSSPAHPQAYLTSSHPISYPANVQSHPNLLPPSHPPRVTPSTSLLHCTLLQPLSLMTAWLQAPPPSTLLTPPNQPEEVKKRCVCVCVCVCVFCTFACMYICTCTFRPHPWQAHRLPFRVWRKSLIMKPVNSVVSLKLATALATDFIDWPSFHCVIWAHIVL